MVEYMCPIKANDSSSPSLTTMCERWEVSEKSIPDCGRKSSHFSVLRVCVRGIEIQTIIRMHSAGNPRQWELVSLSTERRGARAPRKKKWIKARKYRRLCECDLEPHRRCRNYDRLKCDDGDLVCRRQHTASNWSEHVNNVNHFFRVCATNKQNNDAAAAIHDDENNQSDGYGESIHTHPEHFKWRMASIKDP